MKRTFPLINGRFLLKYIVIRVRRLVAAPSSSHVAPQSDLSNAPRNVEPNYVDLAGEDNTGFALDDFLIRCINHDCMNCQQSNL